jgi:myo-inositol 2-dehydrogenase / D-chiro-inositol 1-dehydrogenase
MSAGNMNAGAAAGGASFSLGLVGAGRMGRAHLAALGQSGVVSVAAVAEPAPEARAAVAAEGVAAFASLDEMLAGAGLDGALIAVPTDRHVEVLGQVMAAGLPALCEKPCGLTVEEAGRCAAIAEQAGLMLQVAYWRRFVPALTKLRQRMAGGELGDILAVNCYQWDATPPSAEFRGSSGGIYVDMGVHEFDQVRWLTGQEFRSVKTAAAPGVGTDPDCAQLVAELDGGSTAMVSLGRWHPAGDSCKIEVFGTKGTASSWFLDPAGGDAVFREALRLQAEDFARSVSAGQADRRAALAPSSSAGASVTDAIAALRIAAQADADRSAIGASTSPPALSQCSPGGRPPIPPAQSSPGGRPPIPPAQ